MLPKFNERSWTYLEGVVGVDLVHEEAFALELKILGDLRGQVVELRKF